MEHPNGGMLDQVMESLVQNWTDASPTLFTTLCRGRSDRFRGIITDSTGMSLAAFIKIGNSDNHGQDTLMGLLHCVLPTAAQIKAAGVEGIPVANGYLRVRECYPTDLCDHSSFHDMMITWRSDPVKALALRNANELSISASRRRFGGNNGSVIFSCAVPFAGAAMVTSGEYERTFDSLRQGWELLQGPSKEFHIPGGAKAKALKARLQDPNDRCEFDAAEARQGVRRNLPAFRLRYADVE